MKSHLLYVQSLSKQFVRGIFLNKPTNFRHVVDDISHRLKHAGYRGEEHKVKTDDGYILKIHRVLPKKHTAHKGSAFLMHGLFRNSSDFLATGPKTALAYYLADHGYDGKEFQLLQSIEFNFLSFSLDRQRKRHKILD